MRSCAVASELHAHAFFAHIAEEREKMGDSQEVPDLFAKIDELDARASRLGRDLEANQRAEAHAVDESQIGEVENDALVVGNEGLNLIVELTAEPGDKAAAAMDERHVALALDFEGERIHSRCIRHRLFLDGNGVRGNGFDA